MIKKNLIKIDNFLGSQAYKVFGGKKGITILLFHSVYKNNDDLNNQYLLPSLGITIADLESIFKFLINDNFVFLSLDELENTSQLDSKKKYIYITFDDGYFNNLLIIDLINKYRIPVHLFVNSYNILYNKKYWWDIIYTHEVIKNTNIIDIETQIHEFSKLSLSNILDKLYKKYGKNCELPINDIDRPMHLEELKEFASNKFVTIGNHSHSHSMVTSMSKKEFIIDISECNKFLQKLLNFQTNSFSYPYGISHKKYHTYLKEKNYKFIFTGDSYINEVGGLNNNFLLLGRFSPSQDMNLINQIKSFSFNHTPVNLIKKLKLFLK